MHSCAVCFTICSTGSKFRLVSNFTELHALTQATHSYAFLIVQWCTVMLQHLHNYVETFSQGFVISAMLVLILPHFSQSTKQQHKHTSLIPTLVLLGMGPYIMNEWSGLEMKPYTVKWGWSDLRMGPYIMSGLGMGPYTVKWGWSGLEMGPYTMKWGGVVWEWDHTQWNGMEWSWNGWSCLGRDHVQ